MANLPESAAWTAGIYQLETSDPVLGGAEGIDNLQAKQLANRTLYLKGVVDSLGTGKQPLDATLTAIAALATVADKLIYATGADTFATSTLTAFARTLLDDVDAATARTTLGAQASDATLTALAAVVTAANQLIYATGVDTFATSSLTAFARTLLDDADAAAALATLGAAPLASPAFTGTPAVPTAITGTNTTQAASTAFVQAAVAALVAASPAALDTLNELAAALGDDPNFATTMTNALAGKQPLDATLTAIAALATVADKLIYATGADTFATSTLTAFARTLLDDVDAATARTTLGAQASDATLTALAAVVTAANQLIYATGVDTFAASPLTAFARTLLDDADAASALATLGAAPLASPVFTGNPAVPTAITGTNTTQAASTAFVQAAVAALVAASPAALDTLNELAAALGDDPNFATTITDALAGKQPLDATLTAIAALATVADKLIYATGADTFATSTLTAFARTLLDDVDAATALVTLGAQAASTTFGSGQTWQDVTASRALSTTYTNTTGRPIMIAVGLSGGSITNIGITVNGAQVVYGGYNSASLVAPAMTIVIPAGATYSVTGATSIVKWTELR